MNYIKFLRSLDRNEAEDIINQFLSEIERMGHRVMASKYEIGLNDIDAIFTIQSEPHPHKKIWASRANWQSTCATAMAGFLPEICNACRGKTAVEIW